MNETIWLVVWLMICPICHTIYKETKEGEFISHSYADRNIVECPKCRVAIFSRPENITRKDYVYSDSGDGVSITRKLVKTEVIKRDNASLASELNNE